MNVVSLGLVAEVHVAVCGPARRSGHQRKRNPASLQCLLDHLVCVLVQRSADAPIFDFELSIGVAMVTRVIQRMDLSDFLVGDKRILLNRVWSLGGEKKQHF